MILSDVSIRRPVFAAVVSLLLVAFGILSFQRLSVREYPDIDPPVISVETTYTGAAAAVVETRITQLIEDRIAGIEGIRSIASTSRDGRSDIVVEFTIDRDVDDAANDIRDRVSRIVDNLPEEADPPEVVKVDSDTSPIMWFNLSSPRMNPMELTDYAERYIVDRLSAVSGVARVRIGGSARYAMRVWLDRRALAARNLTVNDIEGALRRQNVELPAGRIESEERNLTVRVERAYRTAADFARLVITRGDDGHLIRLGDVARVEVGPEEEQRWFRGNREPMIGLGIVRQSGANTLDVAEAAQAEVEAIRKTLPETMTLADSYDSSVFISAAIFEVYKTLVIAGLLVVLVIFLFLGNVRATLVPALTVPISLLASFIVLYALGYSINLLTLLALVLSIGLVVDDAIVVLENIHRRIELGEPPLVAAYRGARQVTFAVIATTLVLIAVFVPIAFLEGNIGRLFSELAVAMAAAVGFSSVVALSLSPMLCSKVLKAESGSGSLGAWLDRGLDRLGHGYRKALAGSIRHPAIAAAALVAMLAVIVLVGREVPREFAPEEDRGAFFVAMTAPEGASFEYSSRYMTAIEDDLMPLVESGEAIRVLVRVPRSYGQTEEFNSGFAIVVMDLWENRDRSTQEVMVEVRKTMQHHPGVRAFPIMRRGIGGGVGEPVQFVIGGSTYEELAQARDVLLAAAEANPGLVNVDADYKETKPQLVVDIDTLRAADLGVSIEAIGRTLETMMGSRRVTTYVERGEEYDVILQGRGADRLQPSDLVNIYVRSASTGKLIPLSNLVSLQERADAAVLGRYNKLRAVTITANLEEGYSLGQALAFLEGVVADQLPKVTSVDYKGESREFKESGEAIYFTFALALLVVFLVLAAQFESFLHPLVILLTVPLAVAGAVVGLFLSGGTFNIYSQIGIIMLIGLAAKNGILIVEFANQIRDSGKDVVEAVVEASEKRLRPILMTAIATAAGAVPLVLATGAGSESRVTIGVVVVWGILSATALTLFVVPTFYALTARFTRSPNAVAEDLRREEQSLAGSQGGPAAI